jgi:hypothetical protein
MTNEEYQLIMSTESTSERINVNNKVSSNAMYQ